MTQRLTLLVVLLLTAAGSPADAGSIVALPVPTPAQTWQPVREFSGVPVEARPTDSGFDVHRARVQVCTDLGTLEDYVVDPTRFVDWVAYTRSARLLEHTEQSAVYYVRSTTPWPLRDRDMIYRIERTPTADGLTLSLVGLPEYTPPEDNATRIRSAEGEWRLVPSQAGIDVSYELYVDPGRVPRYLANQRLAAAVGETLANLAARFPCNSG
ncbi:MAG: hypothetical protein AB7I04_04630 [Pseudomonadales bacterium]